MSASIYGNVGGVSHKGKELYVKVNDVNRKIKKEYAKVNGVIRQVYSGYDCIGYSDSATLNANGSFSLSATKAYTVDLFHLHFDSPVVVDSNTLFKILSVTIVPDIPSYSTAKFALDVYNSSNLGTLILTGPAKTIDGGGETNDWQFSTYHAGSYSDFYVVVTNNDQENFTLSAPASCMILNGKALSNIEIK